MGKIRKKRSSFVSKAVFIYFVLCLCFYFLTSIFMKSSNNALSIDIQSKQTLIDNLKIENQQLSIDIQSLENKDRIYTIAENQGLVQNQDNIINIKGSEGNEAK